MNENITLEQLRSDFDYLYGNINDYMANEDVIVNHAFEYLLDLLHETVDLKDFALWAIKDVVDYVINDSSNNDDKEFLQTDERALKILNRYNIKI